jgi:hypothetical protein
MTSLLAENITAEPPSQRQKRLERRETRARYWLNKWVQGNQYERRLIAKKLSTAKGFVVSAIVLEARIMRDNDMMQFAIDLCECIAREKF